MVGPNWVNNFLCCYLFFSTLFILFILWLDCGFAMHLVSRLDLDCCCLLVVIYIWLLVAIDTCSTTLNFIDVRFGFVDRIHNTYIGKVINLGFFSIRVEI